MSALVTEFYERYLLPVVPLSAVGLAWLLSKNKNLINERGLTVALYGFFILNMLVLVAALFLNLGMGAAWYIYPGLLMGMGVLVIMVKNKRHGQAPPVWLAISIMLLFYNGSFTTYQISLPHPGNQVAYFVKRNEIPNGSKIAFVGHLHTGSKMRVGLGKNYFMTDLSQENFQETLYHYDYIIFEDDIKGFRESNNYSIKTVSLNWDPKLIEDMIQGILAGEYREVLEQKGKRYYWGERKSGREIEEGSGSR